MPAPKPLSLSNRHSTKAEHAARTESEQAIMPLTKLTVLPPAELTGHKRAIAAWKYHIGLQNETEAAKNDNPIITAFDGPSLAKYCLLEEECAVMEEMRDELLDDKKEITKEISRLKRKSKKTTEEIEAFISLLEQRNAVISRYQGLDARLDGKRKLSLALAQSLLLTPRSRSGVSLKPMTKEPTDNMKEFD